MKRLVAVSLCLSLLTALSVNAQSHWNGGRTVPVHRLAPLDAEGVAVIPTERYPQPISLVKTCSQCHDVNAMHGGSHFRTGLDTNEAPESVKVEPWFWADEAIGTAIPLSLRTQQGAMKLDQLGLSYWEWTKMFSRNFPGGGIGSDPRAMGEVAMAKQRWFVTGALEANCLACHQQGRTYDSSEWARQVLRENWRGAATAASGFGNVGGMNERLDATWDPSIKENLDDHLFRVPENVTYEKGMFDHKLRCVFDVGKPQNENCLACHSVSQKGMPSHKIMGDVHLRAGMKCIDCHSNGMNHRVETKGCAECHTGEKGEGPRPVHEGIPLVHFKKLSCTVCHSGVTEGGEVAQVRTSRANRIGIYGRAQWATDTPYIIEPVFVKNDNGVVEACRMMWPSYFAFSFGDKLVPIRPNEVKAKIGNVISSSTNGFTKAVVAQALAKLGDKSRFVGHGKVWKAMNGELAATDEKGAEPVSWPIGHDVRPARMARGADPVKCADCHTGDSKFFLGKIMPTGPIVDLAVEAVEQSEFLKVDALYHTVLGTTFAMRPLLKVVLWTIFAFMCLFAACAAAVALAKFSGWLTGRTSAKLWVVFKVLVDVALVCSVLYLAGSGVVGWFMGEMTSWALVLHMVAGGAFAACALLAMLFNTKKRTKKAVSGVIWMLWIVLAAGTVFTAVMPMMTVFGEYGQEMLLWCHRCTSLLFALFSCLVCVSAPKSKKKKR